MKTKLDINFLKTILSDESNQNDLIELLQHPFDDTLFFQGQLEERQERLGEACKMCISDISVPTKTAHNFEDGLKKLYESTSHLLSDFEAASDKIDEILRIENDADEIYIPQPIYTKEDIFCHNDNDLKELKARCKKFYFDSFNHDIGVNSWI